MTPARPAVLAELFLTQRECRLLAYSPEWAEPRLASLWLWRQEAQKAAMALADGLRTNRNPTVDLDAVAPHALREIIARLVLWTEPDQHIVLVPHGALHTLPLHAVPTPDGQALVDRNPVSYVPSATVLRYALSHPPRLDGRASVIVDSDPGDPLPFARVQEAVLRRHRPQAEILPGRDATREAVLAALDKNPGLIHAALHGEMDRTEPMRSGLRLADGRLTAEEILRQPLSGAALTLCACDSGTSALLAGDELLGLARACLFAGARTVLLTQWSIDELSAAMVMDEYYAALDRAGPAQALRAAQLSVRAASASHALEFARWAREHTEDAGARLQISLAEAELCLVAADADGAEQAVAHLPPSEAGERVRAVRGKAALLRRAQARPQPAEPVFTDPYYWAPFVVVGAWKMALTSAPARVIQASSSSVRVTGRRACWPRRSFSAWRTTASLSSQPRSRVRATSRFSGSTASYCRLARSASYRARSTASSKAASRRR